MKFKLVWIAIVLVIGAFIETPLQRMRAASGNAEVPLDRCVFWRYAPHMTGVLRRRRLSAGKRKPHPSRHSRELV